jgi:aminomethyltransferase
MFGIKPCGLGARDTLRLEMKYPLYGNDVTDHTNPLEAGLGWVVKLNKEVFVGRDALLKQQKQTNVRKWVGLRLLEPGIARHGHKIWDVQGTRMLGEVTSGSLSPSLKQSIATAYVPSEESTIGTRITVEIRDKKILAEVVATPFYKRPY